MKGGIKNAIRRWVLPFMDPRGIASLALLPGFFRDFGQYRRRAKGQTVRLRDIHPCLADRLAATPFDPHYFYQGAWLARRLDEARPPAHIDIGSSVLMLSVLSARVPIWFVDYRPLTASLPGLNSIAGSLTALPFATGTVASISSLHVVEHVGLGRYGDPLSPDGSADALSELERVVKPGGKLYLSAPVGEERVCFNAHRVFDPASIVRDVPALHLSKFSFVDDAGQFFENASIGEAKGLEYGCGMFEFVKPHD